MGSLPPSSHNRITGAWECHWGFREGGCPLKWSIQTGKPSGQNMRRSGLTNVSAKALTLCLNDALPWTDNWPNSFFLCICSSHWNQWQLHIQKGQENKVAGWINGVKHCRSLKACAIKLWPHTFSRVTSNLLAYESQLISLSKVSQFIEHIFLRHEHVSSKFTSSLKSL